MTLQRVDLRSTNNAGLLPIAELTHNVGYDEAGTPGRQINYVRKYIHQETYAEDVGILPTNSAVANSAALEQAQADIIGQLGGGKIKFGRGTYNFGPCSSGETIDMGRANILASAACAILKRPTISLEGVGSKDGTKINTEAGVNGIVMLSSSGSAVRDIEFDGGWNGGAGSGSGFSTAIPSSFGRTNLLAPGTFTGTIESWGRLGDGALASVGNRLRHTYNASVVSGPRIQKGFATVIGQEYRLKVSAYRGTMPVGRLQMQLSTTSSVSDVFLTDKVLSGEDYLDYDYHYTFTAVSTTTYVMFSGSGTQSDFNNCYFEIDNIEVCAFTTLEQQCWFRETIIEGCYFHHYNGYGGGIEDGDIINATIRNNHINFVGYDGIDTKQRGPSVKNIGLNIYGNLIEDFGKWADTTGSRGPQVGIDFHGVGNAWGNTVRNFGRVGHFLGGIRMRSGNVTGITYEGAQASKSNCFGNVIETNGLGETYGYVVSSPYCDISGGSVQGATDGVQIGGNQWLAASWCKVRGMTILQPTRYGIQITGDGHTVAACHVDGVTGCVGFQNGGSNTGLLGNMFTGSGTAKVATTTPLSTERSDGANSWE